MKTKLNKTEEKIIQQTEVPLEMIIALFSKHKEQLNEVIDETRDRVDNNMKIIMVFVKRLNGQIEQLKKQIRKSVSQKSVKQKPIDTQKEIAQLKKQVKESEKEMCYVIRYHEKELYGIKNRLDKLEQKK